MKGIVVDIDGKKAAAMTDDGDFVMLPEGVYTLGQEVEIRSASEWQTVAVKKPVANTRRSLRQRVAAVAAAVAISFAGAGTYAYATPYGVVSLDVNPSIEYTINRFDRVLSAETVGLDDAESGLDLSGLKNKTIDAAVSETLEQLESAEYFSEESNYVVMAASTKNDEHTAKVTERMDSVVSDFNEKRGRDIQAGQPEGQPDNAPKQEIKAVSVVVSEEDAERAKELDTTPGKLWLVEKVRDAESEVRDVPDEEFREMLQMPVKDIVEGPGGGHFPGERQEGPGMGEGGRPPVDDRPDGGMPEGPRGGPEGMPDGGH